MRTWPAAHRCCSIPLYVRFIMYSPKMKKKIWICQIGVLTRPLLRLRGRSINFLQYTSVSTFKMLLLLLLCNILMKARRCFKVKLIEGDNLVWRTLVQLHCSSCCSGALLTLNTVREEIFCPHCTVFDLLVAF